MIAVNKNFGGIKNMKKIFSISFWRTAIIILISFKLGEIVIAYYGVESSNKVFSLDLLVKLIIVFIISVSEYEIENRIKEYVSRKESYEKN